MWSSPATASTPPCLRGSGVVGVLEDVAASGRRRAPCRTTCRTRHRTRGAGNRSICWVPQTAVAARSSLMPGWNTMWCCFEEAAWPATARWSKPPERRAAVAGDVAGGVQPGGQVALALHHRQPHQRLDAGEVDSPGLEHVLVVEGRGEGHGRCHGTNRKACHPGLFAGSSDDNSHYRLFPATRMTRACSS